MSRRNKKNAVTVRSGDVEFLKLNTAAWRWRDAYQWLLSLSWPQFCGLVAGFYLALNFLFAALYVVGGPCLAGTRDDSFVDAFFFSVQTIATVGYGHLYPSTFYGNVIATIEIMSGLFLLAVMTGLIFVRFSRPSTNIVFSHTAVISSLNGQSTLMLRIGNQHGHNMVEAEFRILLSRTEPLQEGGDFRYFYNLKLQFDRMPVFPAALTLRHVIDEESPLYGETPESIETGRISLIASVVGIDPVSSAAIQTRQNYTWRDIHFGKRFAEIYHQKSESRLTVDFARLHDTEPVEE